IELIYGFTGSFYIENIAGFIAQHKESYLLSAGIMMIMIALAFKVSAAPFHFWTPDVYEGSPTVITAFMSTVVKTAAFGAFFRLFMNSFSGVNATWSTVL